MTVQQIKEGARRRLGAFALALGVAGGMAVAPAAAQDVDFGRFLTSATGVSGMAVMVAGLGRCDTPLAWGPGFDAGSGQGNPDALAVSCSYYDETDEMDIEKTVIGIFSFWNDAAHLETLTYLP
ncbi:hypothetical protein [Roseibium aestuarii]|uniref:Uncharacterized protein n=1 Tax=Roseibium aestuarii TaxID=2600299 RepID=A0ABW4K153_9HYPH|nr:hypothetical protein [Roseibium aestuarii]